MVMVMDEMEEFFFFFFLLFGEPPLVLYFFVQQPFCMIFKESDKFMSRVNFKEVVKIYILTEVGDIDEYCA